MARLTKKQVDNNLYSIQIVVDSRSELTRAVWHSDLPQRTAVHAALSILANAWADPIYGPTLRYTMRAFLEARE